MASSDRLVTALLQACGRLVETLCQTCGRLSAALWQACGGIVQAFDKFLGSFWLETGSRQVCDRLMTHCGRLLGCFRDALGRLMAGL